MLGVRERAEWDNASDIHETSFLGYATGLAASVQTGVSKTGLSVDVGMQKISYGRGLEILTRLYKT